MALTKIKPNAVDETLDFSFDDVRANTINLRSYDPVNHTNSAYTQANTADQKSVTSGSYANSAYGAANTNSTNITSASSYANGAFASANTRLAISGGTISGDLSVTGLTTLAESTELLSSLSSATGVVTHNLSNGSVFYHTSISANFTANFTNVPTTNDRVIVVSLILVQGATARIPSAVQIDGASQTINWAGGSAPTGNANKRDLVVFSLIRVSSSWTVIGQLSSYG